MLHLDLDEWMNPSMNRKVSAAVPNFGRGFSSSLLFFVLGLQKLGKFLEIDQKVAPIIWRPNQKLQTCKNWGQTVSKADVVLKFSRIFQPIQLTPVIRPSFNYISWTEGRFWGQLLFTKPSKLELFLYTKFWVCFLWLW